MSHCNPPPNTMLRRFVFLGAPGVGKGTFAAIISKQLNIPTISAGDLIREEIRNGSKFGLELKKYNDAGNLVPENFLFQILDKRLESPDCSNGFILDGTPRSLSQAKALDKRTKIDRVINITLNEDLTIEKLLGRRLCSKCKESFNIANLVIPPYDMPALLPTSKSCKGGLGGGDNCSKMMITRDDDTERIIRNRMEIWRKETSPILEFYGKLGIVWNFEVFKGIRDCDRLLKEMTK